MSDALIQFIEENGIEGLVEELSIKVKHYDRGDGQTMYVLNYDQINSPKGHPVSDLCRGSIVSNVGGSWVYLCKSFARFYNLGEYQCTVTSEDIPSLSFDKKMDGSLMKVWYNPFMEKWCFASRGTAFGESNVSDHGITFSELFESVFNDTESLNVEYTYLFELTSPYNRIVTKYSSVSATHLCSIHNKDGHFIQAVNDHITFSSEEDLLNSCEALTDLEEGYVGYLNGVPVVKVKSKAYVAAHRIRGEGLNEKRIIELVLMNEQDEYLSVFPEDSEIVLKYVGMYSEYKKKVEDLYDEVSDIDSQKDFAISIKDKNCSKILFYCRHRKVSVNEGVREMSESFIFKAFKEYTRTGKL